ncbi:MAG: hypothetical protein RIM99_04145 [Cyclobacteriaceae bacterium]
MILYLTEFILLHTLFFIVYKTLLARETQLRFLRLFLVGSTLLALIIPAIEVPTFAQIPTINLNSVATNISTTFPMQLEHEKEASSVLWYIWVFVTVSLFFFLKVCVGLLKIRKWYKSSGHDNSFEFPIRRVPGIQNSFTFFRWIFIDPEHFENPEEIIRHEWGHSRQLHSLDILLFNILSIVLWWAPGLWMTIYELRKIHEYEADQFALKTISKNRYVKTLVHSTLKAHGLNLASSFDDATIVKRLNFIKKMKKKISPWKAGSIMAIILISGAMFACEEEVNEAQLLEPELTEKQVIEDNMTVGAYEFSPLIVEEKFDGVLYELKEKNPDEVFLVVELIRENPDTELILEEYDSDKVEYMLVEKDENPETVKLIVRENK